MKVKNSKNKYINKSIKWYYMLPFILLIAFVSLIMKAKYLNLQGIAALFWTGSKDWVDYFSYWKAVFIVILTVIAFIIYIGLYTDKKLQFKKEFKYYIPLSIYIMFAIISTALCYNKEIALLGFIESYQGLYVLLSYVMLTFLMINFINGEEEIKIIRKAFTILIIIQGLLGIGQFIGLDFFKSYLGRLLVSGDGVLPEDINIIFGKGTIYGTLYNTNFVGSFAAIILPLTIAFYAMAKAKSSKIFAFSLITLSIILWLGCNSRAGYVGVIVSLIFSVVLLRKQIINHKKIVIAFFSMIIIIFISLNIISGGKILSQFSKLNITNEVEKINNLSKDSDKLSNSVIFKDLILEDNKFILITNYDTLTVGYDESFYIVHNNEEKLIVSKTENETITVDNYENYKVSLTNGEYKIASVEAYNRYITFYFIDEGVKILGSGNRLTDPIVAKTFKPLEGYDRFASYRGYIWSRSIMMLPKVVLKGYGPDTYCIAFPQDDYLAELNAGMSTTKVVDKPHNMFLQIAINTGIPSLLALLVLWGIYIIRGIKLYFNSDFNTTEKQVGFACLAAVIGYLVAGIFNDQIVSVAPLFWMVLGMGISLNEKLIKEKLNKKTI